MFSIVIHSYLPKPFILFILLLFFSGSGQSSASSASNTSQEELPDTVTVSKRHFSDLNSLDDFQLSPYTGYTRAHWLEITERIISGVLPYFNEETGTLDVPAVPKEFAYEKLRVKNSTVLSKRALERIMVAVIIYSKATGKDFITGYHGSITAPFMNEILRGTDPESPGYWGEPQPFDQVGSIFAMGAYINPARFWDPLTKQQKKNLLIYWQKQAYNKTYNNNHHYFHMTPVALLEQNGMDGNREHLIKMSERLMGWYRGDGWFIDGGNQGFDQYNLWGFQLYNHVLYKFDSTWKARFGETIRKTTARFLETYIYLYGRDGGPIPWGRSLSYRFAGNSAVSWATINGLCTLPPGQARRILSGSLKYFWEHGCLGENGLLNIGYWGSNTSMAEKYLAPGDPYWAAHGLACLLIPETDPFWTDIEMPMPADGAGGRLTVPGAQFSLRVSPIDGESRLFPVGQPFAHKRNKWQVGAKYDQHAYSSYLGFCVSGADSLEIGAGRTGYSYDGEKWFYRERAQAIQVGSEHLISIYKLQPKAEERKEFSSFTADEITTHTLVGDDGEIHIFWHNYPDPIYLHLGGYGISVPPNERLKEEKKAGSLLIGGGEYYSLLQPIKSPNGKSESNVLIPGEGWNHTHLFGGKGAYPYWRSKTAVPPHVPLIFFVNGTRTRLIKPVETNVQSLSGILRIQFEGKWFTINVPH